MALFLYTIAIAHEDETPHHHEHPIINCTSTNSSEIFNETSKLGSVELIVQTHIYESSELILFRRLFPSSAHFSHKSPLNGRRIITPTENLCQIANGHNEDDPLLHSVKLVDMHEASKRTDYVTLEFRMVRAADETEATDLIERMHEHLTSMKLVKRIFKNQKLIMKKREMKINKSADQN